MALPLNLDPPHQSADTDIDCLMSTSTSSHLAVCTSKTMYKEMYTPIIIIIDLVTMGFKVDSKQ